MAKLFMYLSFTILAIIVISIYGLSGFIMLGFVGSVIIFIGCISWAVSQLIGEDTLDNKTKDLMS